MGKYIVLMNTHRKRANFWTLLTTFIILVVVGPLLADETDVETIKELTERADSGDVDAQRDLAGAYDFGFYGVRSGELAMKYYLLAANQGDADSQNSVGSGLQAEGKFSEARTWYKKASDQDHGLATNNLAYLYDEGLGVAQDRQSALQLYTRAAELGRADAMWNIASMYEAGQLGNKDLLIACIWTSRAINYASRDHSSGEYDRYLARFESELQYLETELSQKDYRRCKSEADAWAPTHRKAQSDQ